MHFLVLAVGLAAAASPAPTAAPVPLTALKVIGHVRSTPFCTALRETIGPAIASVLANDDLIESSKPAFTTLYHDDILAGSEARAHFDVNRIENLETPIIANIKRVDALLDRKPDDPKLQAMRAKLQAVAAQQKESLNVISGFVATEQLGELQLAGPPDNWANIFSAKPQSAPHLGPTVAEPPAAKNLFSAGLPSTGIGAKDPRYDAKTVGPTYDPFLPLVAQIENQRTAAQSAESDAAKLVADALQQCAP